MDIVQLYSNYSVDFKTEGHKHCRPGWANTPCPYCTGNPGYHLGFHMQNNYYVCWRCGWHPVVPTLAILLQEPVRRVIELIRMYGDLYTVYSPPVERDLDKINHRFPAGTGPLTEQHKEYLHSRGFDPEYLERTWFLMGTGPVGRIEGSDYKFRVIIPFLWDGRQVSWDSRDITGKSQERYKACPKKLEIVEHKTILYGLQGYWKHSAGICVEGPTDVWRFGPQSCATSGIKYTDWQVYQMAKNFKRLFVCFDDDPQALEQAEHLVYDLRAYGVESYRITIEGDPGSMEQSEADHFVKQLLK